MTKPVSQKYALAVLVEDKPSTLTRVAGLFTRRAFNIHSLTVGPTEEKGVSRITIITDESTTPIEQVVNQLRKLIYVRKVAILDEIESVQCEVALIKLKRTDENVNIILEVKNRFHTIVVDESADTITIQATEPAPILRELIAEFEQFGVIEIAKSGTIALARGENILKNTHYLGEN